MFDPAAINEELRALKSDLSRLAASTAGEALDETRRQAESLAGQVKALLGELTDTLSDEEAEITRLITERPITSVASAFALGVLVGTLLRRH